MKRSTDYSHSTYYSLFIYLFILKLFDPIFDSIALFLLLQFYIYKMFTNSIVFYCILILKF